MTSFARHLRDLLPWGSATLALLLALAGQARAAELSQQELEYLRTKGAIVFISQTNYPPFEFLDQDGNRVGMCVELARWMSTTLGFKARFADASFQEAQDAVLSGRADVLTSLFYSPRRAQTFDFSHMTFRVPASIFVAAQRPDIKDINDLSGKTIAMPAGDYAQEFLESRGMEFRAVYTRNFAEAADLVVAGQADAVIGDEQVVLYDIYSRHLTQHIKKVGEPLYVGQNCLASKTGDAVLLGILNKGLELARGTGTLEQINRKWLGVHYREDGSFFTRHRLYLLAAAGVMLLASLLIWLWNLQLRRLVRRRTADLARSEATLQAILAASPVGIGLVDNEVMGGVLGWRNPAMNAMLGLPAGQEQDLALDRIFAEEEQYSLAQEALAQALADGGQTQMETRWRRQDGQTLDCLLRVAPLDMAGPGRKALAIASDITSRKQAEEAMREQQERLRLLGDNLPNVVFYQMVSGPGPTRRFTYVSGSVERLNEVTPETVLADANALFSQVPVQYQRELVAREAQASRALTLLKMEVQTLLPSGRSRWFELTASPRSLGDDSVLWDGVQVDVTERKQAEEALRVAEEKQRLVLEESSDPIFSFAPDGTYLYVNKAFAAPFGKQPAEIIGRRIWDVFPREEADRRYAAVKDVFANGQTRVIEVRVPLPQEDLYFVTSVKPVKDEQGRVITVICISKDITERKRAEEALKESEERFRVISEESPLGISLLDKDGRYEYLNPAFTRMFGYTLEQIRQGEDWFRLAFPDPQYRQQTMETWLEDLRGSQPGEVRGRTFQVTCQDGGRKTILFRPVTITRGRQFVIYEDVTQRLEALAALQESERRYRELFDNMSDLIYTQDLEGRFLTVNPALAKLFGYSTEELLGRRAAEFMRADLAPAFESEYLAQLRQQGHHFGLSLYFAKDGGRRYIEYHSSLITPADGPPYISGVGRDVSERIGAEKQLQRLQEQLFQSQKIQALGVLAGGIAHDFNNVLQSISGYTQLMLAEDHTIDANRERLEHIEQSIVRATGMIGHLMTLARKGQTKMERVDLNQEVGRTVRILEHTLPKMITLKTSLAPDLRSVSADATQVEQVLLNLSTNAGQAMPQGGVLTFATTNLDLGGPGLEAVPGLEPGSYVRLEVSDSGLGMDEETRSHIFEPFFTTKPQGQGTGLGLSTVYGIVTNYGGQILCHSRPRQGTTFTIYLPAWPQQDAQASQPPFPPPQAARGSETILVVDDEPAILDTCRQALEERGYGVLTASSGEEALELFLGSPQAIDLVILDLSMPGMGGIKCLGQLLETRPQAKVLVATGYIDEAVTQQINDLGARDLIGKPYRFQDIMARVRALLDA
ncbi:MAG: PAS domain S-box protein [Pseudomonadota bacterium]